VAGVTKTNGSANIGSAGAFTSDMQGKALSGTGIPPNTYMLSHSRTRATRWCRKNATDGTTVTVTLGLSVTPSFGAGLIKRYSVDGSEVSIDSPQWPQWPQLSGSAIPLSIFTGTTLHVRSFASDGTPSDQTTAVYTQVAGGSGGSPTCAAVIYGQGGTLHSTTVTITPHCATPGATIHKSLDGAAYSNYVSGSISVGLNHILDLYASAPGYNDSPVTEIDNYNDRP
jgi:hypothetical protein